MEENFGHTGHINHGKTILIAGEGFVAAHHALQYLKKKGIDVIVIGAGSETINTAPALVINGIKYKRKFNKNNMPKSRNILEMVPEPIIYQGQHYPKNDYKRNRPDVDIEKEFELIQNKQSKLCRRDRDWVESTFNNQYEIIE